MKPNKVCSVVSVVLREKIQQTEMLLFTHPNGDAQIVKRTIERHPY